MGRLCLRLLLFLLAACGGGSKEREHDGARLGAKTADPSRLGPAAESASALSASSPAWDPRRTYALVVGVLRFRDPHIESFPAEHRKDRELYDTLAQAGVPRDQMTLLLDEDATQGAVTAALEGVAKKAPRGSTLLFYYAGHGDKAESGAISFVPFDSAPRTAPGLAVARIGEVLADDFQGDTVLLFADSCFSGGLADVARSLHARGKSAIAFTSAEASNTSTANWTFTQTLIDALVGDPLSDRDGDGVIRLDDLAVEERDAMKLREKQRAGVELAGAPERYSLAPRSGERIDRSSTGLAAIGGYVEAPRNKGAYAVGRVVAARPTELDVLFYDYSDKVKETVELARVRPIRFTRYPVGARLSVWWERKKWPAEVIEVDGDFERITYPGWPSFWDEWILSDRVAGELDAKQR